MKVTIKMLDCRSCANAVPDRTGYLDQLPTLRCALSIICQPCSNASHYEGLAPIQLWNQKARVAPLRPTVVRKKKLDFQSDLKHNTTTDTKQR